MKAADPRLRRVIGKAVASWGEQTARTRARFLDFAWGRAALRARKADALARLPGLLEEFERQAAARGTRVHWAQDAAEARAIVLEVARRSGARTAVKSKSMVTEEIGLNAFLEEHGIRPVETDLGEFIVQLRGEPPSHIVTPAMHLTREDIGRTFHERLGVPEGGSPEELTAAARAALRTGFRASDLGITGANFLVAETGMIAITENEGNARLVTALPRVHVALAGIEKVIATLDELALFLPMLAVSGTGQQLTAYNTLIGGPRAADEADGPEECHVVLLDNGRTRLLADADARETLHCIRCGACLNACPVFRAVGGHAYGTTYQGPIGSVITPHLRASEGFGHLPSASTLCGACNEVCPVGIDLQRQLLRGRRSRARAGGLERLLLRLWAFAAGSERRWRAALALARWLPLRPRASRRDLPQVAPESFRTWWRKRERP